MGDDEGLQVAEITISRRFVATDGDDSDQVWVSCSESLTLLEALGMLRFAEMSVIDQFTGDDEDDD